MKKTPVVATVVPCTKERGAAHWWVFEETPLKKSVAYGRCKFCKKKTVALVWTEDLAREFIYTPSASDVGLRFIDRRSSHLES